MNDKTFNSGLHDRYWLALILIVALAVRAVGIDYSLWYDEVAATKFASQDIEVLWSDWSLRETNPPLFYSLLRLWTAVFGDGDVALRSLPVLIGLIAIPLTYLLGRELFGPKAGLVAAALLALSAQHVFYSQQIRAYSLTFTATAAVLLATIHVRRAILNNGPRSDAIVAWCAFIAANAVALYSHTIMVLLTFLANAWLVGAFILERRALAKFLFQAIAANIAILIIWAWWGRMTLLQMQLAQTNVSWIVRPSIPYAVRMTLEAFTPWDIGLARFAAAAFFGGAAIVAVMKHPRASSLPLVIAAGGPVLMFLLSLVVPVFLSRTVFWAACGFLILVAAGLCSFERRGVRTAAVSIAIVLSAWNVASWWPNRQLEPWRQIVSAIQQKDTAALVITQGRGAAFALERYCPPAQCALEIVSLRTADDERWATGFTPRRELDPDAAESLLRQRGSAVFIDWLGFQPRKVLSHAAYPSNPVEVPGLTGGIAVTTWKAK